MIKGKCIYCKEEKDLNREHAFPQSLLQTGTHGWTINNHLCVTCNSDLGKLDVVLSKRSHIAFVWDRLQRELGIETEGLHDSIYHKRTSGIDPIRLFLPNPVYDNHIVLHEFKEEHDGTINSAYSVDVLRPQIILTQYAEGQTGEKVVADNLEKFNAAGSSEDIIDHDEQEDIYCILGNTYIFTPRAAWPYFSKVEEFKSKFIKDFPCTRYNLRVIYPEDDRTWNIVKAFYNSLHGETKEIIEAKKLEDPEMFAASIQAIPDQDGIPYFARAVAKTAFHCFLYHYPEFSGHESMFDKIKEFIYTGTSNKYVARYENSETENPVYDSAKHLHGVVFFLQGEDIGCRINFFTGLLPSQFSYQITLSGDPDNSMPNCDRVRYIPFFVHPGSPMKRRILPVTELGIIQKPRADEGVLWLPRFQ